MTRRRKIQFVPDLERLEAKQLLNAARVTAAPGEAKGTAPGKLAAAQVAPAAVDRKPDFGYLVYRITNPNRFNDHFTLPFQQVLVQKRQPKPGETYNVLFVTVRNGTAKTFDSSSNFLVKFPNSRDKFPILTGDQKWEPGRWITFYVLTKKYYPLPSQVHSGFEFSLDGARSVGIPGPSGIFLRVKYNPKTIDSTLTKIVLNGPGNQGGKGIKFGLPNTSIYEFLSSKTQRIDFSGYF